MAENEVEGALGELETVEGEQQAQADDAKAVVDDAVPERFRGKTIKDMVELFQTTEKNFSRQGQELGELRKLTQELLTAQLNKPKEQEKQTEVDFFENPQEAVRRAVETNPAVLDARQMAIQARQAQMIQLLNQAHPDYRTLVQDQEFQNWVGASRVRQQLLKSADAYDFDAANELFSTFKELKAVKQQRQEDNGDAKARDKSLQSASVDAGGSGERSKKIYRSADLIQLQIKNPAKFAAMADEINRAYAEGRVR